MQLPRSRRAGDWASPAALAPTLRPLLALIGGDAVPLLVDTVRAVEDWAATRPPGIDEPPRVVGGHATHAARRAVQSLHQPVHAVDGAAPARCVPRRSRRPSAPRSTAYLAGTGCEALLALEPSLDSANAASPS